MLGVVIAALAIAAAVLFWQGVAGFRPEAPRWNDIVLIALGVCAVINAVVLVIGVGNTKLWRRRTKDGQLEAQRWEAFRRYLADFPRLDIAPPATLALWERFLVYGIAFGIAERVLQGAQLHMPEELARGQLDLLDQPARRPRLGCQCARYRRPLVGLRLGPRPALLERLQRLRRRLLRRRRRRGWWRRRRRLVSRKSHLAARWELRHDDSVSDSVVDRGEIEEMMWALADIRVDVGIIRRYLLDEEDDDEEEAEEDEP